MTTKFDSFNGSPHGVYRESPHGVKNEEFIFDDDLIVTFAHRTWTGNEITRVTAEFTGGAGSWDFGTVGDPHCFSITSDQFGGEYYVFGAGKNRNIGIVGPGVPRQPFNKGPLFTGDYDKKNYHLYVGGKLDLADTPKGVVRKSYGNLDPIVTDEWPVEFDGEVRSLVVNSLGEIWVGHRNREADSGIHTLTKLAPDGSILGQSLAVRGDRRGRISDTIHHHHRQRGQHLLWFGCLRLGNPGNPEWRGQTRQQWEFSMGMETPTLGLFSRRNGFRDGHFQWWHTNRYSNWKEFRRGRLETPLNVLPRWRRQITLDKNNSPTATHS